MAAGDLGRTPSTALSLPSLPCILLLVATVLLCKKTEPDCTRPQRDRLNLFCISSYIFPQDHLSYALKCLQQLGCGRPPVWTVLPFWQVCSLEKPPVDWPGSVSPAKTLIDAHGKLADPACCLHMEWFPPCGILPFAVKEHSSRQNMHVDARQIRFRELEREPYQISRFLPILYILSFLLELLADNGFNICRIEAFF